MSRSSRGSDESEALGVDLPDEGLLSDLVLRSRRLDVPDDTDDCWDCEFVVRALEDRHGEGGAIDERKQRTGGAGGAGSEQGRQRACWSEGRCVLDQGLVDEAIRSSEGSDEGESR